MQDALAIAMMVAITVLMPIRTISVQPQVTNPPAERQLAPATAVPTVQPLPQKTAPTTEEIR